MEDAETGEPLEGQDEVISPVSPHQPNVTVTPVLLLTKHRSFTRVRNPHTPAPLGLPSPKQKQLLSHARSYKEALGSP